MNMDAKRRRLPARSRPRPESIFSSTSVISSKPRESRAGQVNRDERRIFNPSLYVFRIPSTPNPADAKTTLVKCPPFYIQLDHTLAVIWFLFSPKEMDRSLGIVQLQWALNFLSGIRNIKGSHPKDVGLCIETIQDELIKEYAAMAPVVCQNNVKWETSATNLVVEETVPFSVNYVEMVQHYPIPFEQIFRAGGTVSFTETEIEKELQEIKRAVFVQPNDPPIASRSKEKISEFLKSWRKEQIDKIQQELKRLHSIETFIENVGQNDFEPYLDEKQLDVLVAQRLNVEEGPAEEKEASPKNNKSSLPIPTVRKERKRAEAPVVKAKPKKTSLKK